MSFFEFISTNWKEHWGYFCRNVIMFAFLFTLVPQLVLILFFLIGVVTKLVWIFIDFKILIFVIKSIPIAAFSMALHGAIMKWNEQKKSRK